MVAWHEFLERFLRSAGILPVIVFLAGLAGAGAGGIWLQNNIDTVAQSRFEHAATRVRNEVRQRRCSAVPTRSFTAPSQAAGTGPAAPC